MAKLQSITKLNISVSLIEEESLKAEGYQSIYPRILLWFKKQAGMKPVTRIQFSFIDKMKIGLADAGYKLINRDLTNGVGRDYIFLWYFHGSTEYDIPIVSLKGSKDAQEEPPLLNDGWERLGCDLKRGAGDKLIYLWAKRAQQSYICEITASVDFWWGIHYV